MRVVVQRVSKASVSVENKIVGEIAQGLLIFLAIHREDVPMVISSMINKIIHLRIFADEMGKMNRSLLDIQGELLIVSQFTLYADCSQGRRPSFIESAPAEMAKAFYDEFIAEAKKHISIVQTGIFGAYMEVNITNDGPITCIIDH